MKSTLFCSVVLASVCAAYAVEVTNISPTAVGRKKTVVVAVDFDKSIQSTPDASKYSLGVPSGERVFCSEVVFRDKRARFIFQLNPHNFVVFENLVGGSAGYFISNDEQIVFEDETLEPGGLEEKTLDRIPLIVGEDWKKYILDEYAARYLFPRLFKVGTQLGIEDSTRTVYFLELIESGMWANTNALSMFWGINGRWSTDREDRMNHVQLYPLTTMFNYGFGRLAFLSGVETGYRGFSKEGRGTFKTVLQVRVPYNPIDLTLGTSRARLNPVLTVDLRGNLGWGDTKVSKDRQSSVEASATVRYDIPVGKNYYLQSEGTGEYSSETHELQYRYDVSLGYIADGSIRIMAQYKQGHQEVTHMFDKKLLLGFAMDVLNQTAAP